MVTMSLKGLDNAEKVLKNHPMYEFSILNWIQFSRLYFILLRFRMYFEALAIEANVDQFHTLE